MWEWDWGVEMMEQICECMHLEEEHSKVTGECLYHNCPCVEMTEQICECGHYHYLNNRCHYSYPWGNCQCKKFTPKRDTSEDEFFKYKLAMHGLLPKNHPGSNPGRGTQNHSPQTKPPIQGQDSREPRNPCADEDANALTGAVNSRDKTEDTQNQELRKVTDAIGRWENHISTQNQEKGCGKKVPAGFDRKEGYPLYDTCGLTIMGDTFLCPTCQEKEK